MQPQEDAQPTTLEEVFTEFVDRVRQAVNLAEVNIAAGIAVEVLANLT